MHISDIINDFNSRSYKYSLIQQEFKKPYHKNVYSRNIEYLMENSNIIKFDTDSWIYRPEIFCVDYYETPYFSPVILLINNLGSFFQFEPDNFQNEYIIAPYTPSIEELLTKTI